MKILIKIVLIFITTNISLLGQGLSDIPPFHIINPNWQYYTYDYFFPQIPNTPNATPYSNRIFVKSLEKGDYFYILEHTFTALKGYHGWDGIRLTKLNKYNGKEEWVHQHNQHTGVKNFEIPSPYIGITSDGNIEILTLRHRDTTIKNDLGWFPFIGTPAIHTIDYKTGSRLYYRYGLDTTRFDHAQSTAGGAKLHRQNEGKYFSLLYRSEINNGITKDFFEFNRVNDSLNIEQTPTTLYEINPVYSAAYNPWTKTIYNKDTLVVLTGLEDKNDFSNSPSQAFLHWFDIRKLDSIHILKTIEVSDAFARPQRNTFKYVPELVFKQGHVFLKQPMQPNSFLPFKNFVWLLWTDASGTILGKLDFITHKDTFYANIIPIGFKNGKAYFFANYYATIDDPIEKWDVLEIEQHSEIIRKICQFESHNHLNGNFRFSIRDAYFLDNGSVVVESQIRLRKNNLDYWYSHICSVKEEDLGIVPTSSSSEINKTWSRVYPNPTSEFIFMQTDQISSYNVEIRDITGSVVSKYQFSNTQTCQMDISVLATGMYYVTISDKNGRVPAMTHKVVKL